MKINSTLWVLVLAVMSSVGCQQMKREYGPNVIGTYVLDHRELPNGQRISAPEIGGVMTFTRDQRNFNVFWMENGKMVSISSMSKYHFDEGKYFEEGSFYAARLPAGNGPAYQSEPMTGSSEYKRDGGTLSFQLPLHGEPMLSFSRFGLKATRAGEFVDYWNKVE